MEQGIRIGYWNWVTIKNRAVGSITNGVFMEHYNWALSGITTWHYWASQLGITTWHYWALQLGHARGIMPGVYLEH